MFIDICLLALLALAFFKGMKQGLVVAAFSFFALILGLAAALKMSALVAKWLSSAMNVQAAWLPFLAFSKTMCYYNRNYPAIIYAGLGQQAGRNIIILLYLHNGIQCTSVLYGTAATD